MLRPGVTSSRSCLPAHGLDDRAAEESAVISEADRYFNSQRPCEREERHPPQFSSESPVHRLCPVESVGIQRRGQCLSDRAASTM